MATSSGGYELNKLKLPKIEHVLEFVSSRTGRHLGGAKKDRNKVIADMVNQVRSIWLKAHCPPKTTKSMKKMYEKLLLKRKKLAKKNRKHALRKLDNEIWDVLAEESERGGLIFDTDFYEDQKNKWERQMEVTVNDEFRDQEQRIKSFTNKRLKRKENEYANLQPASSTEISLAIHQGRVEAGKSTESLFLLFSNEADLSMTDEVENQKIIEKVYEEESSEEQNMSNSSSQSSGSDDEYVPPSVPLRGSTKSMCSTCGCNGLCKEVKPNKQSKSTSIDHFGDDKGIIDPWPKRPIRLDPVRESAMPRRIDPEIIETLIANVCIEQVSFPAAVRSLVRFGNSLCGQNWVLPKSLRRTHNQSIMDRRRKKKKSKFSGKGRFRVNEKTAKTKVVENKLDDEWLDTDEDEEYSEIIEEPIVGYVDKLTGNVTKVNEEPNFSSEDSTEEENVGWDTKEINTNKSEAYSQLVESLGQKIELVELDQIVDNFSEESESQESQNREENNSFHQETITEPRMVAPDVKTLRISRSKIAAYTEKRVTEEILEKSNAVLQMDGTSRGWIRSGKLFTTPIKVSN